MAEVRIARIEDIDYLAPRLRKADLDELKASSDLLPADALRIGFHLGTECYTIAGDDDKAVGMFGVGPATNNPDVGVVWMLASDDLLKYRMQFLRESRKWINKLHGRFQILWNFVDERNTVHTHWLKWLGCQFLNRHEEFGAEKRPFLEFIHV